MDITASMVKDLRERTGVGMMDAKKALTETAGDMEAAIDLLRSKGLAKAAKKGGRTAAEGLVAVAVEGAAGVAVEINSETDFVARNADFQDLCAAVAHVALGGAADIEALKAAPLAGKTVAEVVSEKIVTIGENLVARRMARLAVPQGVVASYVHNAAAPGMGKIGVLVGMESAGDAEKLTALGRQICMHIAAYSPASLGPEDLDPVLIEREKAVLTEQARASGKPDAVIEKMIVGRMNKFYQEVCLLKQAFALNPDIAVEQAVADLAKELGTPVKVTGFVRLAVGEGIEKEKEDFAAEVAKTLGH